MISLVYPEHDTLLHLFATIWEGPGYRFFRIRDFPYLKLGTRDLKAKSGRDSGLKVCLGERCQK